MEALALSIQKAKQRELTLLCAGIHLACPMARKYFFIDSLPLFPKLATIQYLDVEITHINLVNPDTKKLTTLKIDKAFRVPEYPLTFELPAYSEEGLLYGWLVVRFVFVKDRVRLLEEDWVPNTMYSLPNYIVENFEIAVSHPDHYFD